jgi:dTDP-4-amino-4,6-dideoxygalactose transaminase
MTDTDSNNGATNHWVVPLSDVLVDDAIERAVAEVVRSGWWSMGPRVEEFERAFAQLCEAEHAFAVATGTAALHLALLAIGCGPGDEVLVPSLNFVAAANTITHTGATPVFCDVISADDLTVSPTDLEAAITPKTRAIMIMDYGGYACHMDGIMELADRHGLAVIEDAAHAPGGLFRGRACGTLGTIGCFSFFSNKNLPTGEGGMVVTQDDALAEQIRLYRSHGMTTLTWDRHRGHASTYDVVVKGFNYRLDEIRAAIGLVELDRLQAGNEARGQIVERYRAALDGVASISMPFANPQPDVVTTHHVAVILLPEGRPRPEVKAAMAAKGVQTSLHYPPIHRFAAYKEQSRRPLPVTDAIADRLLTLPLFPHMSEAQVSAVVDAVLSSV